jgi:hypothetical protein
MAFAYLHAAFGQGSAICHYRFAEIPASTGNCSFPW